MADPTQDQPKGEGVLRILPQHRPEKRPGPLVPIREVKPGRDVQLMAIRLGTEKREQFYRQGLIENRHVQIIHNDHQGRMVLKVDGELFLLGRRESTQVYVREWIEG